jgi:hypothetical protein
MSGYWIFAKNPWNLDAADKPIISDPGLFNP